MSDKVCHHEDCQEINNGNPLLLCLRCDEVHHLGAGSNHARFDVPGEIAIFFGHENSLCYINFCVYGFY